MFLSSGQLSARVTVALGSSGSRHDMAAPFLAAAQAARLFGDCKTIVYVCAGHCVCATAMSHNALPRSRCCCRHRLPFTVALLDFACCCCCRDMPLAAPPSQVAAAFEALQLNSCAASSSPALAAQQQQQQQQDGAAADGASRLRRFCQQWLLEAGSDLVPAAPPCLTAPPPPGWLPLVTAEPIRRWAAALRCMWGSLCRQVSGAVARCEQLDELPASPIAPASRTAPT